MSLFDLCCPRTGLRSGLAMTGANDERYSTLSSKLDAVAGARRNKESL